MVFFTRHPINGRGTDLEAGEMIIDDLASRKLSFHTACKEVKIIVRN